MGRAHAGRGKIPPARSTVAGRVLAALMHHWRYRWRPGHAARAQGLQRGRGEAERGKREGRRYGGPAVLASRAMRFSRSRPRTRLAFPTRVARLRRHGADVQQTRSRTNGRDCYARHMLHFKPVQPWRGDCVGPVAGGRDVTCALAPCHS